MSWRTFIPSWPRGSKSSTAIVPVYPEPERCEQHPGWLAGTYEYAVCDCAACARARQKQEAGRA